MSKGVVRINGVIGTGPGEVSHQDVLDQLALIGQVDNLEIQINSKGGDIWESVGIYNDLNQYKARKTVYIGIALSCASWIACVGDEIFIAENGICMYHDGRFNPGSATVDELDKCAEMARTVNQQMANTYAKRTGIPQSEIEKGMKETTWLNAKSAVEKGFAHKVIPNKAAVAVCDLAAFNNVPDWVHRDMTSAAMETKQMAEPAATPAVPVTPAVNSTPATPAAAANATATELQTATLATASQPNVIVNVSSQTATPQTPAVPAAVDLEEMRATIRKETRARDREIRATCERAGCPDAANAFIDDDKVTIQDVKDRMLDLLCSQRVPVGVNVAPGAANSAGVPDADAKYRAEFKQYAASMSLGITEDEYVAAAKARAGQK